MRTSARWVGIDVAARALDVVVLGGDGDGVPGVVTSATVTADDTAALTELTRGAAAIGIDAPECPSTAPHRDDLALAPKFRTARCGEIALGQQHHVWVPWTTPVDPAATPPWMHVGFATWAALHTDGHRPIEVYPAGAFRVLAGARPPKKTTRAGRLARIAVLAEHVALPAEIEQWSHDGLDALVAALVAAWSTDGRARPAGHTDRGCDGSAIWIPAG
ncbi:MAG: DUF429 domain-containing protein [Acidimicrobiia bacterium]